MIIKIIPETKEEKERYEAKGLDSLELSNVREFMFFGNQIDNNGELSDFHEWHGSYRYLMGSLNYFYEVINDNRKNQFVPSSNVPLQMAQGQDPTKIIKHGSIPGKIEPLDLSLMENPEDNDGSIDEKGQKKEEAFPEEELEEK